MCRTRRNRKWDAYLASMRHFLLTWIILMTPGATARAEPLSATDDEIRGILAERFDNQKQSVRIVVGIIDANGQRVVAHGRLAKDALVPSMVGIGGYRSFVGFRPSTDVGVVVLSKTATAAGVDDIGKHLLEGERPLTSAPVQRIAITLDPATYDAYVGTCRLAPGFDVTIFRDS
ncbi:MAG: hypothetical protein ACREEJ_06155, partial [Ensifer adhaerens]